MIELRMVFRPPSSTTSGHFSGIRPDYLNGELSRLAWSDIRLARRIIRLDGSITKTGNSRTVEISDNLAAWLEPHAQQTGRLIESPGRFRKKSRYDRGLKFVGCHLAPRLPHEPWKRVGFFG